MVHLPEFEKGTTVTIKSTVADDTGQVVEPDGSDAYIEIEDLSTGDIVVSRELMQNISDTQFKYDWQTTEGMNSGEYAVEVDAEVSSDKFVNRDRVKLVDIIFKER